jgi:hypothetical protein
MVKTNERQIIYPREVSPFKISWEDWVAKWWKWCLKCELEGKNPLLDATGYNCAINQTDPDVWFLAGTMGGRSERDCEIAYGKSVFFPIINNLISYAEYQHLKTESDLLNYARSDLDETSHLKLIVDELEYMNLRNYRVRSNLFGILFPSKFAKTTFTQAISDGYWGFLKPLPTGEHTIFFEGEKLAFDEFIEAANYIDKPKFKVQVRYHLMVR